MSFIANKMSRPFFMTGTAMASRSMRVRYFSAAASDKVDLVVIGGGPGGYVAAIKAAQLGLNTVCVEKRGALGGTCLNVGCIPSKALLQSSHLYEQAQHEFKNHGINVEGLSFDLQKMMNQKDSAVSGLTGGIEGLFKANKVRYVKGFGKIAGQGQVSVELNEGSTETISTNNIMIATGSEIMSIPNVEINDDGGRIVSSTGALKLPEVPKELVVVGGGYIGLEMGSVYRRLGANVTVVEFLDRIVPGLDGEIGKNFMRILKKQGMNFQLNTKVLSAVDDGSGVTLKVAPVNDDSAVTDIQADYVLVSTGRRPYTDNLGLESVGIETDRGKIKVDNHFKTQVDGIFAIGDVIDGPMLAHKAEEEGIACVEMICGKGGHVNYGVIPGVVYTHPEVATVGQTEEQLKEQNIPYNVGKFPFKANSRAMTIEDSEGMVKMISHKETDEILGIHIIGTNAGEMIAEGVLAMEYKASSEDVARTCHAHPTLSEAFKEAAMATYDKPVHIYKK